MSLTLTNIANIKLRQGNTEAAIKAYEEVLVMQKNIGNHPLISRTLNNLAQAYLKKGDKKKALERSLEAAAMARTYKNPEELRGAESVLSEIYELLGDSAQAYKHYKNYIQLRDSLQNVETEKKILQQQMQFEFDKREAKQKAEQDQKEALAQEKIERQQWIVVFSIIGLLLMIGLTIASYKNFLQKKRANELLEEKNKTIQDKQNEILASIQYARRIQQALITNEKYIAKTLNRLMNSK